MPELLFSISDGISNIVINRPEQRNALNAAVLNGIVESVRVAEENPAARVIAITGAGEKCFCAGADLKTGGASFSRADYRSVLCALLNASKPTVALARGHVLGGGLGLYLACDLTLACEDVRFSTPEINVGMFPMMVLALLLRTVERKKAMEMVLLGEPISADRAREYGIVTRVFPRPAFDRNAAEVLGKLAGKSSAILKLGKRAISHTADRDILGDLDYLESALAEVMATEDSAEGMRAFAEKRPPVWRDR
jgi:enoyl-CoA hydratase